MEKEFEMTKEEMNDIMNIAQRKMPIMKFGTHWTGMDKQEMANAYWKKLGEKYGFDASTPRKHPKKGPEFFMAVAIA